ncbi:4-hydroxybenzoate octaprenyltransferase [bacterium]|jgi:4-hydroxybenzoate polyprenyltransferase|nr:4-hydroxybenzoate octaprenyltransferase [bacterium]
MTEAFSSALPVRLKTWGSFVKFSHTVFALPFALGMGVVCSKTTNVSIGQILWIVWCVIAARTSAMAFNRIADQKWDALNPRTSNRELPSGAIKRNEALLLWFLAGIGFLFGSWQLGSHCFILAPIVLAIVCGYSLIKRFSRFSHFFLGFALACAPGGVWFALIGSLTYEPLVLMAAVLFWVAGFDIIYSCQDAQFDRSVGLFSIPSAMGIGSALRIARIAHVISWVLLIIFGMAAELHSPYYILMGVFGVFLLRQNMIIHEKTLHRADNVFFTQNGLASITFLIATLVESLLS